MSATDEETLEWPDEWGFPESEPDPLEDLKKEVAFLRTRLRKVEDEVRRLKWGKTSGRRG